MDGQASLNVFGALQAVELCAQRVRLDNAQAERMVGVAPYALKRLMDDELKELRMYGDADAWLERHNIRIHWAVGGSKGATVGADGLSFLAAPALRELMLWPAADA